MRLDVEPIHRNCNVKQQNICIAPCRLKNRLSAPAAGTAHCRGFRVVQETLDYIGVRVVHSSMAARDFSTPPAGVGVTPHLLQLWDT